MDQRVEDITMEARLIQKSSLYLGLAFFIVCVFTSILLVPQTTAAATPQETCNQQPGNLNSTGTLKQNSDGTFTCTFLFSNGGVESINQATAQINADGTVVGNPVGSGGEKPKADNSASTSCSSIRSFLLNLITCLWRSMFIAIGTALISLTAWLLAVAGLIFNFLLDYTIIEFASRVYEPIRTGIETGWQAFRDIGNIVIIGMFTFIAISMILGVEAFGTRKLVARVLIIAVLINFSLLFTKIIIDSSHFIAHEFYTAALEQVGGAATSIPGISDASGLNPVGGFAQKGIAGQFIKLTGLSGIWDTASKLLAVSDATQSGWLTMVHSVAAATLILGLALVLLYGAFLLVARAVALIFLLTTSSLAFASHLLPDSVTGEYGWKAWWKLLINNAIFAPLFMIFLWMSLTVGTQLTAKTGTLGSFFNNPTDPTGLNVIFGYLLVVGLLYASIRIANHFASQAAAKFVGMTLGAPLALGSRLLAAPLLRGTLGRYGYKHERALEQELENAKTPEEKERAANRLYQSKRFGIASLGRKTFNPFDTGAGKLLAGRAGISGLGETGKGAQRGFGGIASDRAKEGGEAAKGVKPDDRLVAAIRKNAEDQHRQTSDNQRTLKERESARDAAAAKHDAVQREYTSQIKGLQDESKKAAEELTATRRTEESLRDAEKAASNAKLAELEKQKAAPSADQQKIQTEIQKEIESQAKKVQERDGKVEDAADKARKAAKLITDKENEVAGAKSASELAQKALESFESELEEGAKNAGKGAVENAGKEFNEAAQRVAARAALGPVSSAMSRLVGLSPENTLIGSAGAKQVAKVRKAQDLEDAAAAFGIKKDKEESVPKPTDRKKSA